MMFKIMVVWWVLYAFLGTVHPPIYHQPITGANYLRRQAQAQQAWKEADRGSQT